MLKPGYHQILLLGILLLTTLTAGCVTVGDQRVDVLYQTAANATGGSGDLYLVEESTRTSGGAASIQWIIGEIRNSHGEKLGNTVTDMAPTDILASAFTQELKRAGYNTIRLTSMPKDAAKGLVLKSAVIKIDELKTTSSLEAKSKVTVSIEPWRDGGPLSRLRYEADYSETAVTGRDRLAAKTLLQAIRTVMTRSVPEIVKMLEQK